MISELAFQVSIFVVVEASVLVGFALVHLFACLADRVFQCYYCFESSSPLVPKRIFDAYLMMDM